MNNISIQKKRGIYLLFFPTVETYELRTIVRAASLSKITMTCSKLRGQVPFPAGSKDIFLILTFGKMISQKFIPIVGPPWKPEFF